MNPYRHFRDEVVRLLERMAAAGELPAGLDFGRVAVEPPRDPAHGDLSTNAAMVLAKPAGMPPRALAERLVPRLAEHAAVTAAEAAGPGFINLRLASSFWLDRLREVLRAGPAYGDSDMGRGTKVNVEYVSANPTGPLHVGHGRGAVFGDALAALLAKAGYAVTKEYYINDAGAQLEALARSVHFRYREALGQDLGAMPEGLYPGDYLVPVGRKLAERDGAKWLAAPEEGPQGWREACASFGRDEMMALIGADLAALGIRQDRTVSERDQHRTGKVGHAFESLKGKGLIYEGVLEPPKGRPIEDWEPRKQWLFRATEFGDDVDRPLKKSDGSWTYFAGDIAYHLDKIERGFGSLIDVWGADHGGYVKRMKAAVSALSDGKVDLDVKICQLVNLLRDGEPVKMSKRAGTFVTLREVVQEVGKDVVRFIMLTRRNDAPLDFDLVKVTEQSRDNPVFYVQYAHARARSVMRHAAVELPEIDLSPTALAAAPLDRLTDPAELGLIKLMAGWPRLVETAAEAHEPHRVAFYLYDLAAAFHALWNKGKDEASLRFLLPADRGLTTARLALVRGVAAVIASGLGVVGVQPAEEMR